MAITKPKKAAKPALYKMVSVNAIKPKGNATKETKAVASSLVAFTTSINKIGATLNSVAIKIAEVQNVMGDNLKMDIEEQKKREAAWKESRLPNTREKDKKDNPFLSALGGFAKAVVPDFFQSLASLGQFLMRAFLGQAFLRWMSDPKNGEKIANIVGGLMKVFKFLYTFITENLFKGIEGLVDMFDENKSFWERLQGFGNFITGFGALLIGFVFLKKPGLIIRGLTWVLTTLWKSMFKSKADLAAQVAKQKAMGGFKGGGGLGGGGGKGGRGIKGMLGQFALTAGATATGVVVGNALSGGGGDPAPAATPMETAPAMEAAPAAPEPPRNFEGGIVTKPTNAVVGERGPEARLPLTTIPSNNNQLRKNAGIQDLPKPQGGEAKRDPKRAQNLSKLMLTPFKAIGGGILGKISEVTSGLGPAGKEVVPHLTNIVSKTANAFGVPPGMVKSVQGKMEGIVKDPTAAIGKVGDGLKDLMGKGKDIVTKATEFVKTGDTSVLGLLTQLNTAVQVLGNKLTEDEDGGGGILGGAKNFLSGLFGGGGQDKEEETKAATGEKGDVGENQSEGEEKPDTSGSFSQIADAIAKLNTPTPPAEAEGGEKKEEEKLPEKDKGGWISGPMSGYPVSLGGGIPDFIGHGTEWVGYKKAMGGGVGDAFVVPFDTPATKNNPGLTQSRMTQAKVSGYSLPQFAAGGSALARKEAFDEKIGGDKRPRTRKLMDKGGKAGAKIVQGAQRALGFGRGQSNQCATSTRYALAKAGHPAAKKRTQKGDLDSKGTAYNGAAFAASFAGSDMGTVIKSPGALAAGDIVLWKGGGGYGPGEITHVGIKGPGSSLYHHGRTPGFRKASMYTSYGAQKFAAGIRLDGEPGTVEGSDSSADLSGDLGGGGGDGADTAPEPKDPTSAFNAIANAIVKLNQMSGGGSEVATQTSSTSAAKSEAQASNLNNATQKVQAAAQQATAQTNVGAGAKSPSPPSQPIILPGKDNNIEIESLNPATSILQGS